MTLNLPENSLPTAETQLRIFLLICALSRKRHVKSDENECGVTCKGFAPNFTSHT